MYLYWSLTNNYTPSLDNGSVPITVKNFFLLLSHLLCTYTWLAKPSLRLCIGHVIAVRAQLNLIKLESKKTGIRLEGGKFTKQYFENYVKARRQTGILSRGEKTHPAISRESCE